MRIQDQKPEQVLARAYNDFAAHCTDKLERGTWGKTVLTIDWAKGKIVRVEVTDTTTTKPQA